MSLEMMKYTLSCQKGFYTNSSCFCLARRNKSRRKEKKSIGMAARWPYRQRRQYLMSTIIVGVKIISYEDENCKCMKPNKIYVKIFCNVFRKLFLLAPGNTSYIFYEFKFLKPEWFCNPFLFLEALFSISGRENCIDSIL